MPATPLPPFVPLLGLPEDNLREQNPEPTLLEAQPPTTDWSDWGWSVIDRPTWQLLAALVGLPDEARLELVDIVLAAKARQRDIAQAPGPPSQYRQEIASLKGHAEKLAAGLQALSPGAASAVRIALSAEPEYKDVPLLQPSGAPDPFDPEVAAIARWAERLARAAEVAHDWHGKSSRDPLLCKMVGTLHYLMVRRTGLGLVRSSEASKRDGRASACSQFVRAVAEIALGHQETDLDGVIWEVIGAKGSV